MPLPSPAPPDLVALHRWLESKQRKGCLPGTLRRYERVVNGVLQALWREGRPTDPGGWTLDDGLRIKEIRHQDAWSLIIIADFAHFAGSRVFEEVGIPPTPPRRKVRWLSREEVRAILEATQGDPLLAFVAVLGLGQGMRRIEWQRLQLQDVDLPGARLLIRGKGRSGPKVCWSPLHPAFPAIYRRYLSERDQVIARARERYPFCPVPPEVLVLPSRIAHGLRPYSDHALDDVVRQIQRKLGEKGLSVHLSSHMFRRSGATLLEQTLLESPEASHDGVYRTVQEFLRHENLATTMKYLDSNPRRQRKALDEYAKAFPWPT